MKVPSRRLRGVLPVGVIASLLAFAATASAQVGVDHPDGVGDVQGAAAADAHDRYIVTVRDGHDAASLALRVDGERPAFVYSDALHGFAAQLTPAELQDLRNDPAVEDVEPDTVVHATTTQTMDPAGDPWGLDRIDQPTLPASGTYSFNGTGAAARAFVIDTGVDDSHPEFVDGPSLPSRARRVFDVFGGNGSDCNGHGTHVAGTIGGKTYGVAKRVQIRGVRVLDCSGSGTLAGVIAGIDWVRAHRGSARAVANLSLGGSRSQALNDAVNQLVSSGVFVSVAAGNEHGDACGSSPSSAAKAYTVAASDKTDTAASFSNFGPCVDGYAPGVGVVSSIPGGGTARFSGTSMASPHVAGIGALLKGYANFSPAFITSWVDAFSIKAAIAGAPAGTRNNLVYKGEL